MRGGSGREGMCLERMKERPVLQRLKRSVACIGESEREELGGDVI